MLAMQTRGLLWRRLGVWVQAHLEQDRARLWARILEAVVECPGRPDQNSGLVRDTWVFHDQPSLSLQGSGYVRKTLSYILVAASTSTLELYIPSRQRLSTNSLTWESWQEGLGHHSVLWVSFLFWSVPYSPFWGPVLSLWCCIEGVQEKWLLGHFRITYN